MAVTLAAVGSGRQFHLNLNLNLIPPPPQEPAGLQGAKGPVREDRPLHTSCHVRRDEAAADVAARRRSPPLPLQVKGAGVGLSEKPAQRGPDLPSGGTQPLRDGEVLRDQRDAVRRRPLHSHRKRGGEEGGLRLSDQGPTQGDGGGVSCHLGGIVEALGGETGICRSALLPRGQR